MTPLSASRDLQLRGSRARRGSRGAVMGELRFLPRSVVVQVAEREGVPLVVAQGLAARAVLDAAIRSECRRNHDRFPELERRRHQAAIYQHIIEREDRDVDRA
jgi:hypothetical protein